MAEEMVVFGRYRLLKELGKGGMASVYMAFDPILERTVALKLIRSDVAADHLSLTRFLNEAKVCASLGHVNIVTIFDYGVHENIQYIVMEYIDGPNLAQMVSMCRNELSEAVIISILQQIAEGLSVAHSHGIVHRDIKPENIMINSSGVLKITDFGIAHQQYGPHLTITGNLIGSPRYMAPEQINGLKPTNKTDLFALGGVLSFLCTGKPPFPGSSAIELFKNIAVSDPVPIRQINPGFSQELEACISTLLRKEPRDRTLDALALCEFTASYQKRYQSDPSAAVLRALVTEVGFRPNKTIADADLAVMKLRTSQRFGAALASSGIVATAQRLESGAQTASPTADRSASPVTTAAGKRSRRTAVMMLMLLCIAAAVGTAAFFASRYLSVKGAVTVIQPDSTAQQGTMHVRDSGSSAGIRDSGAIAGGRDTVASTKPDRHDSTSPAAGYTSRGTTGSGRTGKGKTGKGKTGDHTDRTAASTNRDSQPSVTAGSGGPGDTGQTGDAAVLAKADSLHEAYLQSKRDLAKGHIRVMLSAIRSGTPPPNTEIIGAISENLQVQPTVAMEIADAVIERSATNEQLREYLQMIRYFKIAAHMQLKQYDGVAKAGIEYKRHYPTGEYFDAATSMMQAAEQMKNMPR